MSAHSLYSLISKLIGRALIRHNNKAAVKVVSVAAFAFSLLSTTHVFAEGAHPQKLSDLIDTKLWGELYKDGGTTYYCDKSFTRKTPLLSASYIYPSAAIRQHLKCGTKRQCIRDNARYRTIASDLNNIVVANSYFEMKKSNTIFGILDQSVSPDACGIRRKMHVIEPPVHLSGDIARVIFYMHQRYQLPIIGNRSDLEVWAENDPPSTEELERNQHIDRIQGYANPVLSKSPDAPLLSVR